VTIAKVEVERFSLTSSKPFDAVVASLRSAVGQPDIVEFFKATRAANSFPDLERVVQSDLGCTDLMLFAEFDLGAILRREAGSETPKVMRFVVGNPLIIKEMVKHVPDAGSYAPVTILVDERPDGVHVSYDKMVSYLLPYGSSEALTVAHNLDMHMRDDMMRKSQPCCANAQAKPPDDVFGRWKEHIKRAIVQRDTRCRDAGQTIGPLIKGQPPSTTPARRPSWT
jgi:uncharacterized protein (DUF302 family)